MGKQRSKIEIYIALANGFKPRELMKLGVPKNTAYGLSWKFKKNKIMEKYRLLLAGKYAD